MAIADIARRKPTLDDVFLRLTGHGAETATEAADPASEGEEPMTTATTTAGGSLAYRPLERLRWAARDGFLVAGRDVAHWVREPQLIAWTLVFPIIFVVLFAYVLGSAMQVPGGLSYQEYVLPGMFVQTMAFGLGETLAAVQADNAKGVMDRFRSMPIAPSAVVVGRSLAGLLYSLVSLVILIGAGLLVGWRWHGTAWETLGRHRAPAPRADGLPLARHLPRLAGQEPGDGQRDLRPAVSRHHGLQRVRPARADADVALASSRR